MQLSNLFFLFAFFFLSNIYFFFFPNYFSSQNDGQ